MILENFMDISVIITEFSSLKSFKTRLTHDLSIYLKKQFFIKSKSFLFFDHDVSPTPSSMFTQPYTPQQLPHCHPCSGVLSVG